MPKQAKVTAKPSKRPASKPASKPKSQKADIQIIEGDSSILLIAPHACIRNGKTKNDENTGPITELAARQLGCSAIINTLFRKPKLPKYSLDQNMMLVKVPYWNRAFDVVAKDRLVPGISFSNSEIGRISFCVEGFFWRLACSNGLIVAVSAGHFRFKHISRKALDNFSETISKVIEDSSRRREQFTISTKTPVQNPIEAIEAFNRRFALSKDEGETVVREWESDPGRNMWAVINAYTAAAKEPELMPEDSYRLEKAGG